ncbi:uncharacterized protein LOC115687223 [Syzygium oleosum]|uniref:uncharacterized protein LOC115687223 n=1 Tax=Syzygium oleosum TaxID=219896 RepID=UPI0024BB1A80|nr:uncharacterized protein LOC115687223 [Syzygium oleosum]
MLSSIIKFCKIAMRCLGMEGSDFSQTQGRGTKRDRRVWTIDEENALLDGLEELVARGMKADNGFKSGYMIMLEKWVQEKFPGSGIKGNPHIESKMRYLKKLYNQIYDLKDQSGFGWDHEKHSVDIHSEDSWQKYCKAYPGAASLRGKSFPQYDRLATVFGRDRAKGNLSEDPSEAHAAVDNEESENHSDVATTGANQNLPPLSSSQMQNVADSSRRKRAKASDKWAAGLVEIASTFGSFMEKANERMEMIASHIGHAKDLDDDKRKINEELLKMSLDTMDRIKLCRKIVKDPENIHLFFGFQGDDRKAFVDMLLQEMIEE